VISLHEIATNKPMDYQQPPPPIAIVQPVIVGGPVTIVGDYPMQCTCPRCGQQIVTRIEKKNGLLAWVICGILFFFGLWCCCCIPFCVDGCKVSNIFIENIFLFL
jgi:lipopolysaccharide-induced tumor necrosis factor-alpha factor